MPLPNVSGKDSSTPRTVRTTSSTHLRGNGWDPGPLPESVIFTYGGFDLLCSAQPDNYSVNPMLGPGPGRFFLVNSTDGRVGVCCMGIGAPAVVAQLEVLVALGVRRFLSVGTAGGLGPDGTPGDLVVLTGAIRDEGTSYHYATPGIEVSPDAGPHRAADRRSDARSADANGTNLDDRRPVPPERRGDRRVPPAGPNTVEMEAAALFAVARAAESISPRRSCSTACTASRSDRPRWTPRPPSGTSTSCSSSPSTSWLELARQAEAPIPRGPHPGLSKPS